MATLGSQNVDPLLRKLESTTQLTPDERSAVLQLPLTVKVVPADSDIVREGDRPNECCLVLEGFVCRYKLLHDGRRQILSFHIAGDIPDVQNLHLEIMDHSLSTLVRSTVGLIPHQALDRLHDTHPRLAKVFWRDTLIDAAIFREWMASIGRRTAIERAARMLCEVLVRMRAVGLATDHHCELPLTQTELADALGLSAVHVNRVLQELRANGLMVLSGGSLTIQDWTGLKEAASIRPTSTYAATWSETQPHELGAASDACGPSVNRRREQIEQLAEAAVARPFRKQSFSGIGTASGKFAVQFYRGRAGITGAPPRGL